MLVRLSSITRNHSVMNSLAMSQHITNDSCVPRGRCEQALEYLEGLGSSLTFHQRNFIQLLKTDMDAARDNFGDFPSVSDSREPPPKAEGSRIQFIKALRERWPTMGLKEAKDISEWLEKAVTDRGFDKPRLV